MENNSSNKHTTMELEPEIWKEAFGLNGYYLISTFGRIISIERYVTIPNKTPFLKKQTFLKQKINMDNYYSIMACMDSVKKCVLTHRLVAQTFIPNSENKPCVNHIDGNKLNNHVSNLEWCTTQENSKHAKENNLVVYGEKQHLSKLKEKDVLEIRKNYKKGIGYKLAREYKVTPRVIYLVIKGKTWKRV